MAGGLSARNVALTSGSQAAFFLVFNMFAGSFGDGLTRKILLPMAPEYIGYADVGLEEGIFTAHRPTIEILPGRTFKYHVDFDRLGRGRSHGRDMRVPPHQSHRQRADRPRGGKAG